MTRTSESLRITAAEMRFMRDIAGVTKWEHKQNEAILKDLQIESILKYLKNQRKKLGDC